MLVVFTSWTDPDLPLFKARPGVGIVVPAHLSQPGWRYQVGSGTRANLVTSRGPIVASDITGVLTRTQRTWPAELPHIDPADRDYVAGEMTAFLAALLNELPCPLLNRPTATSLWGPPWTPEHWWRAAAAEGLAVCRNDDCSEVTRVVILGRRAIHGGGMLSDALEDRLVRLAERAGVLLLEATCCRRHAALQRISLRPVLDDRVLDILERYCAAGQRAS